MREKKKFKIKDGSEDIAEDGEMENSLVESSKTENDESELSPDKQEFSEESSIKSETEESELPLDKNNLSDESSKIKELDFNNVTQTNDEKS